MSATLIPAALLIAAAASVAAQSPAATPPGATPAFAVASIKPSAPTTPGSPVFLAAGARPGFFDIDLVYAGSPQPETTADHSDAPASVFTAVQEQLGLKLESRKEKMDVLVIDQVEMPTPN